MINGLNVLEDEKAYVGFTEKQLTELLKKLPDDDTEFRPYLQKAGENIFRWK